MQMDVFIELNVVPTLQVSCSVFGATRDAINLFDTSPLCHRNKHAGLQCHSPIFPIIYLSQSRGYTAKLDTFAATPRARRVPFKQGGAQPLPHLVSTRQGHAINIIVSHRTCFSHLSGTYSPLAP